MRCISGPGAELAEVVVGRTVGDGSAQNKGEKERGREGDGEGEGEKERRQASKKQAQDLRVRSRVYRIGEAAMRVLSSRQSVRVEENMESQVSVRTRKQQVMLPGTLLKENTSFN